LNYISAYATMHPWEDFAETWSTYLQIVSQLDTAFNVGLLPTDIVKTMDMKLMVLESQKLSLALNEMNRSYGLIDVMPKALMAPVVTKLEYINRLVLQK
jgi:hypothetical protein